MRDDLHHLLVEHSPDIIVVHDGERILFANRQAAVGFGVADPSEIVGRRIQEFVPAQAWPAVEARIARMLEEGISQPPVDLPFLRADGSTAHGELLSAPLTYEGRPAVQTVIRDITRRRQAEEQLSATRARFESLFDAVPVGLYRSTADGRFLSVNRALVDMLGYPDEAALRAIRSTELYLDPAERDAWVRDAVRDGVVEGRDIRLRHWSGSEVRARLSTRVTRGADGAVLHFEGAVEDVTASHRMEARYRLLFETMAQGVVYHDREGRIVEANPAAERILGYGEGELVGRSSADPGWQAVATDGSSVGGGEHPSMRALRERRPVRGSLLGVYNPARQEHRWIEIEAIPLFRPGEDEPHQVYATFEDVTDRLRAERDLRRSEQRLDLALAGSGLGLWDWDVTTGEIFVDDRWYRTLGYQPGEFSLRYDTWVELVHPDDRERVESALDRHLRGDSAHYLCEIRIRTRTGGWKWILDRGQVVERDDQGRAVRATGTHTDIDERKAAEEAQHRSEERLATIFRAAPLGITLSLVRDGTFVEVNDAFAELFGHTAATLVGRPSVDVGLWVDPEQRRTVMRQLLRDGRLRGATVHFRAADGQVREIQLFAEVITVDGELCALSLHRDVTEARRLEEQLRQAQKMEAVGRLAGGIAHDFNNMLTAIIGHVRFLLEALPSGDERRADAEQIEASADRAKRLTRQLLAFSRQQVLRPRVVGLGDVIASFEPLLARIIGEDVLLDVRTDGPDCRVRVDPGQLEQVVLNLAVNARDAMPEGGRLGILSGRAEVAATAPGAPEGTGPAAETGSVPPGRYALLRVTDTGTGMDAATRERVFEPFFTTKPAGKGTGLGLSTVYGIVNQSEGFITVRSAPGAGSTFTIYLPLVEGEVEPMPAGPPDGQEPGRGSETILLVEDEPAVRSLAVRVLEGAGYRVHSAPDGASALHLARRLSGVDLVLTDVIMPGIGGPELAECLREATPGLRVVFMSGYTGDEVLRDQERSSGGFLEKPFTPRQLTRAVRAALDA